MHKNRKMIPVTIPVMRVGGIIENGERVNSNMIHLIYYKNFCKCYNGPPTSTIMKTGKNSN
jgi:hypothetical protein